MSISAFALLFIAALLGSTLLAPRLFAGASACSRHVRALCSAHLSEAERLLVAIVRGVLIGGVAIIIALCAASWTAVLTIACASIANYPDMSVWRVALVSAAALIAIANLVFAFVFTIRINGTASLKALVVTNVATALGCAIPFLIWGSAHLWQLGLR